MNNESLRKTMYQRIWMEHINDELYKRGVITEDEKNKAQLKIDAMFKEKK